MTRISRTGGGGGSAISSVSNSDGTLTISPTTGAVVASLALSHANTWTATQTFREIDTSADNTYPIGTATNRFSVIHSVLFNVEHASTDANPSAQLGDGFLKFGAGGANALDNSLSRTPTAYTSNSILLQVIPNNSVTVFAMAPTGTNTTSLLSVYRTSTVTTNFEVLSMGSDLQGFTGFTFQSLAGGTGTTRPIIFIVGATEALRFQTASPYVKFNEGATGTGTPAFGANCPAVTVGAPYTWIKVASADGSVVYIPAWK